MGILRGLLGSVLASLLILWMPHQASGVGAAESISPRLISSLDASIFTGSSNKTSGAAGAGDACKTLEGYASITVREVFWSVAHSLEVIGKKRSNAVGERLGFITTKLFGVKTEQEWFGKDGTFIAASHKDLINAQLIPVVHVSNCRMLPIATVEEVMEQSFTSSVLLYTVRNMKDTVIASSREGELLGKSYVRLSDATTGTSLLNIYKGPSKFLDSWTADFSTDATGLAVDVRVVALMLAGGSQDLAFGMGAMPFIMFLLSMLGVVVCCCFFNRQRLLEWATSAGDDRYDEISDIDRF